MSNYSAYEMLLDWIDISADETDNSKSTIMNDAIWEYFQNHKPEEYLERREAYLQAEWDKLSLKRAMLDQMRKTNRINAEALMRKWITKQKGKIVKEELEDFLRMEICGKFMYSWEEGANLYRDVADVMNHETVAKVAEQQLKLDNVVKTSGYSERDEQLLQVLARH